MPIPFIAIGVGIATWAPRALSAINMVFNTALGASVTAAVAHKATDGKSTQLMLNGAEAVVGEKGVRAAGGAVRDTAKYIGEGVMGVGQTLGERYPSQQGVMPPPVTGTSFIVSGVGLALNDPVHSGGVNIRQKPDVSTNFSSSAQGQGAIPTVQEPAPAVAAPAAQQESRPVVAMAAPGTSR